MAMLWGYGNGVCLWHRAMGVPKCYGYGHSVGIWLWVELLLWLLPWLRSMA